MKGPRSERTNSPRVARGLSEAVKNFFLYFQNVTNPGKLSENRAVGLTGHLSGEPIDSYYEQYVEIAKLSGTAKKFNAVQKIFVWTLEESKPSEGKIQCAVSGTFGFADVSVSLRGADSLFKEAGLYENAKLGLPRQDVPEHIRLFQFVL